MGTLRRLPSAPRPDWQARARQIGYTYFRNEDGSPAWREDVRYDFSPQAVQTLRRVTEDLHTLCLRVVDDAINTPGGLDVFHIPPLVQEVVRASWRRDEPFLLGRFDFAWCDGQPKLIEYNADTPATVPESTRMQSLWRAEVAPQAEQMPLDAGRIVARLLQLRAEARVSQTLHIVPYPDNTEDAVHARYYRDWAQQAGLEAVQCELRDLEISTRGHLLHKGRVVRSMLRMYPWELMFRDPGARHLAQCGCVFLNPPWTALLSNKALLPVLWQRYPEHPNLLPAGFDPATVTAHRPGSWYVEKPIHARGGENVRLLKAGRILCSEGGTYGAYPKVYQAFADHSIQGVTASVGAWVIGHSFAGITMRESADRIIRHTSPIVPHTIRRSSFVSRLLGR